MEKKLTVEDLREAARKLMDLGLLERCYLGPYYYFTRGTRVSDEAAVEYFKDNSDVIVVTRDDKLYRRGKQITPEGK